jgi:hypothetical protein
MLLRLVALGVVIGVAGAAAAQWTALRWLGARQVSVAEPPSPALSPQPVLPLDGPRRAAPAAVTLRSAAPAGSQPVPVPVLVPAPAPAQSSRLGREAASLQVALSALRGRAAEQALAALDRHLLEFPGGALELEARVARVDALLALGRRKDARRELAALPIERVGRKQELRLIRAELTADGDCRRALADFDALNEQPLPGPWAERALFGRAACRLELGDAAGAERDFSRYLARFPDGRFAAQIRARGPR